MWGYLVKSSENSNNSLKLEEVKFEVQDHIRMYSTFLFIACWYRVACLGQVIFLLH